MKKLCVVLLLLAASVALLSIGRGAAAGDLGANWTALENSIEIADNEITETGLSNFSVAYWSADPFNNNQYSKIQVIQLASDAIIEATVRVSGSSGSGNYSFYAVWVDGTNWGMYKTVAGSGDTTLIASTARAVSSGDTVEIRASGTIISFYHNGNFVQSATDSSLTSGSAGINLYHGNGATPPIADNWEGGNL